MSPTSPTGPSSQPALWFRSLSRHTTDRDGARRSQPGLLASLLGDPTTGVVLVDARGRVALQAPKQVTDLPDDGLTPTPPSDADQAVWHQSANNPRNAEGPGTRLAQLTAADLPQELLAELVDSQHHPSPRLQTIYLGREQATSSPSPGTNPPRSWVALVVPATTAADATALAAGATEAETLPGAGTTSDAEGASRPDAALLELLARHPLTALRAVGAELDAHDAGLATPAVALAAWHAHTSFCPACAGRLTPTDAGWARRCTSCGTTHFPRTDPAVIMAVTDAQDRLLLVHGATWPQRRYSVVAGFVEAGESAEQAVRREVAEETGLEVASVEPLTTQPWPFPRSLMLAYRARLAPGALAPRPDGKEVTDAILVTRSQLAEAVRDGAIGLPGPTSVARALIEDWYTTPGPA